MKLHERAIVFAAVLILVSVIGLTDTIAQSSRSMPDASSKSGDDQPERMGTPEREFAHRSLIARAESEHKQNIKRAAEVASLTQELRLAFDESRTPSPLTSPQIKNIEKIEKLARRIRGYVGGSDGDAIEVALPGQIAESIVRIAEVGTRLQQEVEKSSRQVVSAKIIADANELIALTRHVRRLAQP